VQAFRLHLPVPYSCSKFSEAPISSAENPCQTDPNLKLIAFSYQMEFWRTTGSLVEALEDGVKQEGRVYGVLIDGADGIGAMYEHAVGDSGAGDGGEPTVADGVLRGERGKDGESRRGEALHDVAGANGILGQGVVVADEAAHVGGDGNAVAEDLCGDVTEIVVRVGGEVVDVASVRSDDDIGIELTGRVVPLVAVESIDGRVEGLHEAEHVIE
jgi:hypothetical protein